MKKQKEVNESLLNIITPLGLEFGNKDIKIGENIGRNYTIIKYPNTLKVGWLGKLSGINGSIMTSTFIPLPESEVIKAISKDISNNRVIENTARENYRRLVAERRAKDGEKILKQIDENGECVGKMINVIMATGSNPESLNKVSRKIENTAIGMGCRIRNAAFLQKDGYKAVSPYNKMPADIEELGGRVTLLSTFMGGFFASSDGFNDVNGYYFAKDNNGGLMIMDLWKRGGDRTNSNMTILGSPGKGKSTAVKKIILNEYMLGTKIIVIDPEREYDEITKQLCGDWINLGGSENGKLNPLEVKPIDLDDDEIEIGMGELALHLQSLEVFFSLYFESITERQKALLNETLIELYKNFKFDWETKVDEFRKTGMFPTMEDLYNLLSYKSNEKEKILKQGEINDYEELTILVKNAVLGSDKFIFNGQTSFETSKNIICLDTHDLNNASERVKKSQYYNIITWCWQQIIKDRKEKVMLICDEAYLLIDPEIPQTLIGLRNIAKRCRKYDGSLVVVSQSIVDFLDSRIKMYGQAILNLPCYKIFLGSDGKDLEEIVETFDLKESHRDIILGGQQGRGLLVNGSKHYVFNMELTDYEARYIIGGKGGR